MTTCMNKLRLDCRPIFIVGYPRSGTTLIQALIATQEDVVSFPETHFFDYCAKGVSPDDHLNFMDIERILHKVQDKMCIEFGDDALANLREIVEKKKVCKKDVFDFVVQESIKKFSEDKVVENKELRWVEKTPSHAKHLREILSLYPRAKFIVMVREPLKAIISRKTKIPADARRTVRNLAKSWSRLYGDIHRLQDTFGDYLKICRLEDLLHDRKRSLLDLCHFLEINCDETRFENFGREARGILTEGESWKTNVEKGRFVKNENYKVNLFNRCIIKKTTARIAFLYKYTNR